MEPQKKPAKSSEEDAIKSNIKTRLKMSAACVKVWNHIATLELEQLAYSLDLPPPSIQDLVDVVPSNPKARLDTTTSLMDISERIEEVISSIDELSKLKEMRERIEANESIQVMPHTMASLENEH